MEIKLSDGRTARIKEGKGKDLFWAMEHANSQNEIIKTANCKACGDRWQTHERG